MVSPDKLRQLRATDGQAFGEYALIVSFVAAVCAATLGALGIGVDGPMNSLTGRSRP